MTFLPSFLPPFPLCMFSCKTTLNKALILLWELVIKKHIIRRFYPTNKTMLTANL